MFAKSTKTLPSTIGSRLKFFTLNCILLFGFACQKAVDKIIPVFHAQELMQFDTTILSLESLPSGKSFVLPQNSDGLYTSLSTGGTYSFLPGPNNTPIEQLVVLDDLHIYALIEQTCFESINGGESWNAITTCKTIGKSEIQKLRISDFDYSGGFENLRYFVLELTEMGTFDTLKVFEKTDLQLSGFTESSAHKIEFDGAFAIFTDYEYFASGARHIPYRIYSFSKNKYENIQKVNYRNCPSFSSSSQGLLIAKKKESFQSQTVGSVLFYRDFDDLTNEMQSFRLNQEGYIGMNFQIMENNIIVFCNNQLYSNLPFLKGISTTYLSPIYDAVTLSATRETGVEMIEIIDEHSFYIVNNKNRLVHITMQL